MWRLVEHGRVGDNPAFYFREFAAPDGCALDDEVAWHDANPALSDFLAERETHLLERRGFRSDEVRAVAPYWIRPANALPPKRKNIY